VCASIGFSVGGIFYALLYVSAASLQWPTLLMRMLGVNDPLPVHLARGDVSFMLYVMLYVLFFWGLVTLVYKSRLLRQEKSALTLLEQKFPSSRILSKRGEIDALKATVTHGPDGPRIRHTALGQTLVFLMDHCLVTETSSRVVEIFTRRLDTLQKHVESSYSMLQYIAWAIPSVGFIGTVWGIGIAIGNAGFAADDLKMVTQPLGVAFDTTLIALLESLVLMFFMYNMQHKEENLLNSIDLFCQEKFIINLRLEKE
jgi:biopolymer transport protein ExbB/TolQ